MELKTLYQQKQVTMTAFSMQKEQEAGRRFAMVNSDG
jgi:hypothetical protein